MKTSYVYALLDPRKPGNFEYNVGGALVNFDHEPFYIGKGVRSRMLKHEAHARKFPEPTTRDFKTNKIRSIHRDGLSLITVKIIESLDDQESLYFERALISTIGRFAEGGTLTNHTLGGEGHLGYFATEATKEKMRSAHALRQPEQKEQITKRRLSNVDLFAVAALANKTKEQHTPEKRAAIQAQRRATIASLGDDVRVARAAKASDAMRARNLLNPVAHVTCPHCGKTGSPRGVKKHHFDRCSQKP